VRETLINGKKEELGILQPSQKISLFNCSSNMKLLSDG
jgi:hypothetical protein